MMKIIMDSLNSVQKLKRTLEYLRLGGSNKALMIQLEILLELLIIDKLTIFNKIKKSTLEKDKHTNK